MESSKASRWKRYLRKNDARHASSVMSEKIKYTDESLGDFKVVPDFLPRPEELVFRDEGVKVTIALSKRSVEFFKGEVRKHHTQYPRMIRRLLDAYAEHHLRSRVPRLTRTRTKLARPVSSALDGEPRGRKNLLRGAQHVIFGA